MCYHVLASRFDCLENANVASPLLRIGYTHYGHFSWLAIQKITEHLEYLSHV